MCKWGDTVVLEIGGKLRNIDRCIAPIVKALNMGGVATIASCCGHDQAPGIIALEDGRDIRIFSADKDVRHVEELFSPFLH